MRPARSRIAAVLVTVLASCSATRLTTTWKAPGVTQLRFTKLIAFVVAKDEAVMRAGEQALCAKITTVPCTPALAVVPDTDRGNVDAVSKAVAAAGFDGAVVLRYSGERVQQTYVQTAPMWGYYGYGWGIAYDPGYIRQDQLVDVETTIYSVPDQKLLWAGVTETMNPRDVRRTVDEIVDAVAKAMRREGLIAPAI